MKHLRCIVTITLLVLGLSLSGEIPRSQVVFAYLGLSSGPAPSAIGLRDSDIQAVENRIRGALLDIARQENYSIATPRNANSLVDQLRSATAARVRDDMIAAAAGLSANGVLAFQLDRSGGLLSLKASMYAIPGGDLVTETTIQAADVETLLGSVGPQIYGLFGIEMPRPAGERTAGIGSRPATGAFARDRELAVRDIAGIWQGDYDQVRVELKPDGSGLIWLNEVDTMRVRYEVNGQIVKVRQDEPNSPKLYLSVFPYTIAVQVVRMARPMSWEFRVTPELDRMIGRKDTSYFFIEQNRVLQVDNTYSRDAVWTRMP